MSISLHEMINVICINHALFINRRYVMHVFMHIRVHRDFMNEHVAKATVHPHRCYRFTARSFATVTSVSVDISVVYGLSTNMRECARKAPFSMRVLQRRSPRAEWYAPFHS